MAWAISLPCLLTTRPRVGIGQQIGDQALALIGAAARAAGGLHTGDEDLVGRRVIGDGAHVEAHAHALALDLADLLGHDLEHGTAQRGGEQRLHCLLDELGARRADVPEELGHEQRPSLLHLPTGVFPGNAHLPFEHRRDQDDRVVGPQQGDGRGQVGPDQAEHRQAVQVLQGQAAPGGEEVRERHGSHRRMKGFGVVRPRRLNSPAQ